MTFLNECILRLRTGSLISCGILATECQDRYVIIMTGTSGTFFLNTVDFYKKLYLFIFFFFLKVRATEKGRQRSSVCCFIPQIPTAAWTWQQSQEPELHSGLPCGSHHLLSPGYTFAGSRIRGGVGSKGTLIRDPSTPTSVLTAVSQCPPLHTVLVAFRRPR